MRCTVGQTQLTIDTLPDDALLYVFDFYLVQASQIEAWNILIHVCRRWRTLVFESPCRLNLRITCTDKTSVKEKLDVWPALPVVISGSCKSLTSLDNVKAALKHHDRVCQIKLYFDVCEVENIAASLEEPFPILTDLDLSAVGSFRRFNPDLSKFLGGSANLRSLTLSCIRIADPLKLLLSTPHLVILRLDRISNSIALLPDELVTGLSGLTRLEQLDFQVVFHRSHPDWENHCIPPLKRTVFPSLTVLKVVGDSRNLDDFMAQIDTPLLDHLYILFSFSEFDRITGFVLDTPHLLQFIGRIPKLQAPEEAHIGFDKFQMWINFFCSTRISRRVLRLGISCTEPERQFPCLAQICRSPHFPLHPLYLYIGDGQFSQHRQQNHTENTRWLELLQSFASVKNLYLTKEFALHIAHALQELVGERVMEVLPNLKNIFIDEFEPSGPVHEVMKEFVYARQLTGHLIIISRWDIKSAEQDADNRYSKCLNSQTSIVLFFVNTNDLNFLYDDI